MKVRHYLRRLGGSVIGLRDRVRYDLFFRTTAFIIAVQIASAILMLGIFWWALQYTQTNLIDSIADYIVELVSRYPALPSEDFASVADRVKTQSVLLVFIGMAVLSAIFGFLLSSVTLRPARKALRYQKRFIGNVAHELRTPLSIIKTQTEVALLDPEVTAPVRATLNETIVELDRISEIINNLLSFNTLMRPERMEFANVDISGVIDKVTQTYAPLAERNGVTVSALKRARWVWGNATALEQVVANLVKNAIYYTPKQKGGEVVVCAGYRASGAVELSISDNGIGIPSDELFHIFDPFYRGDTSRARGMGGTSGLGLAIVNEIVRIHRGKILVASAPNKGTTVTVILPEGSSVRAEKGEVEVAVAERRAATGATRGDAAFSEITHDFSRGL